MRLQEIQCFLSCCCLKTNWVLVYYNSDTSVVPDVRNQEIFNLELAAEWRDFLFNPIAARDLTGGNSEIQVSEFQFWDSTSLEFDLPAQGATAVAWLNSGSSPSGAEPGKAVDGDVTTKWVEQDIQTSSGLHVQLSNPAVLSSWRWVTGNDLISRDPVQWNLWSLH